MTIQQATYAVPREDLGEAIHEYELTQEGFIAGDVLPTRPVMKSAATVSVITRENIKRADAAHSNGAAFNRVDLKTEDLAYQTQNKGLEGLLTDKDRENYATDFEAELETSENIRHKLMMEREIRVKTLIFNETTWSGAALFTDNSGSPWDAIGTNIIAQVQAAKEKVRQNTGSVAKAMVIGATTLNNMLKNTGIIARFPGVTVITEAILLANLSAILGLENLFVGKKTYDSANDNQTFTAADVWPDDYAMIARINKGSLKSGGLGRTLTWSPFTTDPDVISVEQYREEQTKSDVFRVEHDLEEKIFDVFFGHLLKIDA